MSFRVSAVCEDPTLDQYLVVPLLRSLMAAVGKPHASVTVVTNPKLNGISTVETNFASIATRYAAVANLVVFAVDRDAEAGRRAKFDSLRSALPPSAAAKVRVLLAVEETEVWSLWGSRSEISATWAEVRAERDPKERFFDPLLIPTDATQPGRGRGRLIKASLSAGWASLASGCPELADLEADVRTMV